MRSGWTLHCRGKGPRVELCVLLMSRIHMGLAFWVKLPSKLSDQRLLIEPKAQTRSNRSPLMTEPEC